MPEKLELDRGQHVKGSNPFIHPESPAPRCLPGHSPPSPTSLSEVLQMPPFFPQLNPPPLLPPPSQACPTSLSIGYSYMHISSLRLPLNHPLTHPYLQPQRDTSSFLLTFIN